MQIFKSKDNFPINMININLAKRFGMSPGEMYSVLERNKSDSTSVFLFSEITFRKKYTQKRIKEIIDDMPLQENTYVFFSAYELESEEEVNARKKEWMKDNKDFFGEPSLEIFLDLYPQVYINKGFFVFSQNNEKIYYSYRKNHTTFLDMANEDSENSVVSLNIDNVKRETLWYGGDPSNIRIAFPYLRIDGKNLEFRVCRDIEFGTKNKPDVILVSAFGDSYIRESKSLDGQLVIVNDPISFFPPVWGRNSGSYEPIHRNFNGYIFDGMRIRTVK